MSNILITNPKQHYAEILFADGRRLAIRDIYRQFSEYGAEVILQGPIGGTFDNEFDLRDEAKLFEGTLAECFDVIVELAQKHFDVIEISQVVGRAKLKCAQCGEHWADYGEDLCQRCIDKAIAAHEANRERAAGQSFEPDGIPF